jgi:hypothetical protein
MALSALRLSGVGIAIGGRHLIRDLSAEIAPETWTVPADVRVVARDDDPMLLHAVPGGFIVVQSIVVDSSPSLSTAGSWRCFRGSELARLRCVPNRRWRVRLHSVLVTSWP